MEEIIEATASLTINDHSVRKWLAEPRAMATLDFYNNNPNNEVNTPMIEINQDFDTVDVVPGLKTMLYPHQKTIVKAMVELEKERIVTIDTTDAIYTNTCSAAILSDPVGSGKTIDILSLILLQKYPKKMDDIRSRRGSRAPEGRTGGAAVLPDDIRSRRGPAVLPDDISKISNHKPPFGLDEPINHSRNYNYKHHGFRGIIRRKFDNILSPTIIFVGSSVFAQWIEAIEQFTDLTYLIVDDVRKLEKMLNCVLNGSINEYDIILIKNGKITRTVKPPEGLILEKKNEIKAGHIYNIVANLRDYCWSRVVVDDFDTIGIPKNASIINGLMTWFISSTTKLMHSRRAPTVENKLYHTTEEYLDAIDYHPASILLNPLLFTVFNLRNSLDFIKESNEIPQVVFYQYQFEDPVGKYANMLNALSAEGREIVEMLNSDATATAAEKAGIKSTSVADIFQRMLGVQYDTWISAKNIIEFIDKESPKPRIPFKDHPDQTATYCKSDLLNFRSIEYQYRGLKHLFEETRKEYQEIYIKSGMAIQRVKDNIKANSCPICFGEFGDEENENDENGKDPAEASESSGSSISMPSEVDNNNEMSKDDIVIFKCCSVIVCSVCTFGVIFAKNKLYGICANCRKEVGINDIVFISNTFDITKIVDNNLNYDQKKSQETSKEEEEKQELNEPQIKSKIDCLMSIITGNNSSVSSAISALRKKIDLNVKHLMKGVNFKPITQEVKKILVFSNYNECLNQIRETLTKNKINYYKLDGSRHHIHHIIEQFKNDSNPAVLLINSIEHCSGLNLQIATDLVFMHLINDKNIESQVLGRGQRIGRTCSLTVHYLLYSNEIARMNIM